MGIKLKEHVQMERFLPIDRGWAWVVLFCSFMSLMLTCGALYSVGVFHVVFLDAFGESSALTSWVGSLLIGLQAILGPVSSLITNRIGWRASVITGGVIAGVGTFLSAWATKIEHLFICFGIISGIGHGLIYTPSVVVVGYYFDRMRTAATGIASVGAGMSMLIFPPIIQLLVASFSWRESLVIASCLYLQICVFGALMRPLPLHNIPTDLTFSVRDDDVVSAKATAERQPGCSPVCCSARRLEENVKLAVFRFIIFCVSIFLFGIGLSSIYLHLPAFAVKNGATKEEASLLLSMIGGFSIVSRVFTGLAGNDQSIENTILYIGTFGISGIFTLMFPFVGQAYWGRMLYAAVFGFYGSCFNVLLAPITVEIVGLRFLTTAFGLEMVVCGLSYMLGPPLAGWLHDYTGTFDNSFYLAGMCLITSSCVMMLSSLFHKSRHKKSCEAKPLHKELGEHRETMI